MFIPIVSIYHCLYLSLSLYTYTYIYGKPIWQPVTFGLACLSFLKLLLAAKQTRHSWEVPSASEPSMNPMTWVGWIPHGAMDTQKNWNELGSFLAKEMLLFQIEQNIS